MMRRSAYCARLLFKATGLWLLRTAFDSARHQVNAAPGERVPEHHYDLGHGP
jgi:hypothetical protein